MVSESGALTRDDEIRHLPMLALKPGSVRPSSKLPVGEYAAAVP